jgi:hypothetical protein
MATAQPWLTYNDTGKVVFPEPTGFHICPPSEWNQYFVQRSNEA